MGKTIISADLSQNSIRNAIKEIELYQKNFNSKIGIVMERLSAIGFETVVSNLPTSQAVTNHKIAWTDNVKIIQITATGTLVLFFEFGSGIYYNSGNANPWQGKYGMGVGTYPEQTHAFDKNGWVYYGNDNQFHHSYGIKATMPMYKASKMMLELAKAEIREVFK